MAMLWASWIAALSTGLTQECRGNIVAHELGHKRPGSNGWWIGRLNLLSVPFFAFYYRAQLYAPQACCYL
ncbi:MAG: hypothetical protein CM1200mP14_16910 [Gammaproteobacteria bacterium]|nr:MAG: hypothetical protein CM1200mP14_16910 [Gammaproteobacteria bacterium]